MQVVCSYKAGSMYIKTSVLDSLTPLLIFPPPSPSSRRYPKTLTLSLNFLLKLISFNDMYKDIFREVGILTMLSNALKEYASQLKEDRTGVPVCVRERKETEGRVMGRVRERVRGRVGRE